jgi:hypothetical protein
VEVLRKVISAQPTKIESYFFCRYWLTLSAKYRHIRSPTDYTYESITASQKKQLCCAYQMLCKFIEWENLQKKDMLAKADGKHFVPID